MSNSFNSSIWVRLYSIANGQFFPNLNHEYAATDLYYALEGTGQGVFVEGRLIQPGLIRRDMYGRGRTMGQFEINVGVIELSNSDGALDVLSDESFDGFQFRLVGNNDAVGVILSGYIEQPVFEDESVTFQVRDVQHALDKQLLTNKYAGTNVLPAGVEGTSNDIKGRPKPAIWGRVSNVPPVCVNTSRQIYQLDGVRGLMVGYTGFSLAVYDKRSVLTRGADYTSQADMETNAPTAGQYRVWPSGGMFRTNAAHTLLTADVDNPALAEALPGAPSSTLSRVIGALVDVADGPLLDNPAYVENDPAIGIYVNDERTILSVVQEVSQSVQVFLTTGVSPAVGYNETYSVYDTNRVWAGQLSDPASVPYTPILDIVELDEDDIIEKSLRSVVPPEATRGLPVWRVNLKYAKNYRVMSATDLAGSALSELATWSQEYRTVTAEDDGVLLGAWPNAAELDVTTLIATEADAQAEADRLLSLFSVYRRMFTLSIHGDSVPEPPEGYEQYGSFRKLFQIGARIRITYPRFGLDDGKLFILTGLQYDFERDVYELTVWG